MGKRGRKRLKSLLWAFIILAVFTISLIILVKAGNSESSLLSEWRMFGRHLNHTAYDGTSFSVAPGLMSQSFQTGAIGYSSPAIFNGYVYIGTEESKVYQLNASNVSQHINNFTAVGAILGSPAVVIIGSSSYVYIGGSGIANFYQLNASNISQKIAQASFGSGYSSPIVANGSVYVGDYGNKIYQVNATNISQGIGYFQMSTYMYASAAVANNYLYTGGAHGTLGFYQLNATNISMPQIANYTAQSFNYRSSPAVWDKYVYFGTAVNNTIPGAIYQLNATNISHYISNYSFGLPGSSGAITSPAITTIGSNTYLYLGGTVNTEYSLYQLNASNVSQKIANYSLGGIGGSPTIANGYVYVGSNDDYVYQLNASNVSKFIGKVYVGGDVYTTPAYANGYLYFGSWNGFVYQVNASNLSLLTLVDITNPLVIIDYPWTLPTTYTSTFPIGMHMNEQGYCEYSINNGTANHTLSTNDNTFFHGTSSVVSDGDYTIYAYCNDTAGNRNDTEKLSFRMYTIPSGGGETTQTTTTTIPSITEGQPTTVTITNSNIEVGGVSITTIENVSSVSVTVQEVNRSRLADFEIGVTTRQIYQALNISVKGLNNSQIENATVYFRVNISWVEDLRRYTEEDVRLFRRNDATNRWQALPTTLLSNDSQYYYYSAITPGFSTFVIFYGRYDCEPGISRCFESQVQMCLGNATWLTTEKCTYGCDNQGACLESLFQSKTFYTLLIAVVSVGIVVVFYIVFVRIFKRKKGRR